MTSSSSSSSSTPTILVRIGQCRDRVTPDRAAELIAMREPGEDYEILEPDGWTIGHDDDGCVYVISPDGSCAGLYEADEPE